MLGVHSVIAGRRRPPRRRTLAVAVFAVAAVMPVGGLGWACSPARHTLRRTRANGIPAYMTQNAELGPEHGILVVTGSVATD